MPSMPELMGNYMPITGGNPLKGSAGPQPPENYGDTNLPPKPQVPSFQDWLSQMVGAQGSQTVMADPAQVKQYMAAYQQHAQQMMQQWQQEVETTQSMQKYRDQSYQDQLDRWKKEVAEKTKILPGPRQTESGRGNEVPTKWDTGPGSIFNRPIRGLGV